jgi:cytochrome c5
MTQSKESKAPFQKTLVVVIATMVIGGLTSTLCSAGPETAVSPSQTNVASSQTNSADTNTPVAQGQITGAELYSIHCNRCHPERYPTERTAANWKTIMLHMQVRANLPAAQARLILKYLQDNSGR